MGRRLTHDEVIAQFQVVHGDTYDYSKFVYGGNLVRGIIICRTHGEFEQLPFDHKRGRGCPKCTTNQPLTQDEVIAQFQVVHENFYDYSKFVYLGDKEKGIIICRTHGEFEQPPHDHKRGRGCPKCNGGRNRRLTQDEVIAQFRVVHGDTYDYSKFVYIGAHEKGIIICRTHGEFEQPPHDHKRGRGCQLCAAERSKGGYDTLTSEQRTRILDVYLYHLELEYMGTIFHKVGITGDPHRRLYKIQRDSGATILNGWIYMYKNAENAFKCEQRVLDYMMIERAERYYHPVKFGGETECFTPVPNPNGWNLDLNNIPKRSERFNYNDVDP